METQTAIDTNELEKLSDACLTSASYLYSAAQQIRNRGLKLIFKTYAQQRLRFKDDLQSLSTTDKENTLEQASDPISRGWMSIRAGLSIQRFRRQRLVIREVLTQEDVLIGHYEAVLQPALSSTLATTLQKQLTMLYTQRSRLGLLADEKSARTLFVRLFNQDDEAKQVLDQLAVAGILASDIDVVPIERFSLFREEESESNRSQRNTVLTGTLLGAGIGALLSLIAGLGQSILMPAAGGFFGDSLVGIVGGWLIGGVLIGAFFGFVFSMLIGQDASEDDAYVYNESIENGNTLLAVFATPSNRSSIERIVGLKHQFEVKPKKM